MGDLCVYIHASKNSQNQQHIYSKSCRIRFKLIMPRKYVRRTNSNYSNDEMSHALADIKNKKLIVANVALQYHIPVSIFYSQLSRQTGNTNRSRSPILSKDEEQFLVYIIKLFQEWQQPLTRKCLIDGSTKIGRCEN